MEKETKVSKTQDGYYDAPKSKAWSFQLYANFAWYDCENLIRVVKSIRNIDFSVIEQRRQALELLNNVDSSAPYSWHERFPEDKYFICEGKFNWTRKFQQLKSALSFRDSNLAKTGREVHDSTDNQRFQSNSDAQQAFWNATTTLYDAIVRGEGIYHREVFEEEFSLQWVESQDKPEAKDKNKGKKGEEEEEEL